MKQYRDIITSSIGTIISFTGMSISTEQLAQIISIICSIVGLCITLGTIVLKIINWYKKAKEDGKIDDDEINELSNIIEDGKNEIAEHVDENKKEGE